MSAAEPTVTEAPSPSAGKADRLATPHFLVAAAVLLVAAVGWNAAMQWMGWALAKEPVPWPAGVSASEHRLTTFPLKLPVTGKPRYEMLLVRGPIPKEAQKNVAPDGQLKFPDETVMELGVKAHPLNWYFRGIFRPLDATPANDRVRIQVTITYYTGLLDAVPHVPDICILAAGGQIVGRETRQLNLTAAPPGWDRDWVNLKAQRTVYELKDGKGCEYHFFSMNGQATDSREAVRWKMALPWLKYCYFAKVQLGATVPGPDGQLVPLPDLEQSDRLCQDFLASALPEILRFLPTVAAVEALERGTNTTTKGATD